MTRPLTARGRRRPTRATKIAVRSGLLAPGRLPVPGDILRPAGSVNDTHLARALDLMSATSVRRAFEGAFTLLLNEEPLHQLRADLQALRGALAYAAATAGSSTLGQLFADLPDELRQQVARFLSR